MPVNDSILSTKASKGTSALRGRVGGSSRPSLILRPYQIKGIQYLRQHNGRGSLIWEMRLGKTITTIRFIKQRKDSKRILIVAPYSALCSWYEDLIQDGSKNIHLIYKIPPKDRTELLFSSEKEIGWFLVNKEAFLYCDYLRLQWDSIIVDETWLANPKAKITKYFLKYTQARYRILLTGTPAPESELQYFTQLHWVNPGVLGKSYWDYRIRNFRPEGMKWRITMKGRHKLARVLVDNCSVLTRKDVGLQKEKIFEKRVIQLLPATLKKYEEAESGIYDGKILKFAGQWWNEMRRLCSGKEKEVELLDLLNGELKNERVIIWCDYVEEVERVAGLLCCAFIHGTTPPLQRDGMRKHFLKKGKYLVAQPQCWKWGTNLAGVDTVIFFSMPQGLMTWQQVCERTAPEFFA